MALENLVDGMTGLQMANALKNNFDKVLNAESEENKAENAGLSIKTDYDATRYIDLQLADGTPVKMKMDVFCQAIAPVVAGLTHTNGFKKDVLILNPSKSKSFEYNTSGGLMILRTGFNQSVGLYMLNLGSGYSAIKEAPGADTYFTIVADNGTITITNTYTGSVEISIMIVNLD